jgi:hypothetical protein
LDAAINMVEERNMIHNSLKTGAGFGIISTETVFYEDSTHRNSTKCLLASARTG